MSGVLFQKIIKFIYENIQPVKRNFSVDYLRHNFFHSSEHFAVHPYSQRYLCDMTIRWTSFIFQNINYEKYLLVPQFGLVHFALVFNEKKKSVTA